MELTDEQLHQLELLVHRNVSISALRIELLDHLCCHIENALNEGMPYETALKQALEQLAPDGLTTVEDETVFLLTFKKQITMKKFLYSSGFLAAFLIIAGLMFKLLHLPGADPLLVSGNTAFLISTVLLLIVVVRNLQSLSKLTQFRSCSGAVGGMLFAAGSLFKLFWMPGAHILMLSGVIIIALIFLPALFLQLYRRDVAGG